MFHARFAAILTTLCIGLPTVAAETNTPAGRTAAERANLGGLGDLINRSTTKPSRTTKEQGGKGGLGSQGDARQKPLDAELVDGARSAGRGYLGVVCSETDSKGRGAKITRVAPGSPAEQGGLQQSDVITGVGGVRVRQLADLSSILREAHPGATLTFEVQRGKDRTRIDVTFGRQPAAAVAANPSGDDAERSAPAIPDGSKPAGKAPVRPIAKSPARPAARVTDDSDTSEPDTPQTDADTQRVPAKLAERLGLEPRENNRSAGAPRGRTDRDWDALLQRLERLERRIEQLERREAPAGRSQ